MQINFEIHGAFGRGNETLTFAVVFLQLSYSGKAVLVIGKGPMVYPKKSRKHYIT